MKRLLIALALFAPAYAEPKDLQGHWRASGQSPNPDGRPGPSWFVEYDFKADDSYVMNGYPPIREVGTFQFETKDGKLQVHFSHRVVEGGKQHDLTYPATLSGDGKTLHFNGKDFLRSAK